MAKKKTTSTKQKELTPREYMQMAIEEMNKSLNEKYGLPLPEYTLEDPFLTNIPAEYEISEEDIRNTRVI